MFCAIYGFQLRNAVFFFSVINLKTAWTKRTKSTKIMPLNLNRGKQGIELFLNRTRIPYLDAMDKYIRHTSIHKRFKVYTKELLLLPTAINSSSRAARTCIQQPHRKSSYKKHYTTEKKNGLFKNLSCHYFIRYRSFF